MNTPQIQPWMIKWIRNYGDWEFVPEKIQEDCRDEKEVAEIIAKAIQSHQSQIAVINCKDGDTLVFKTNMPIPMQAMIATQKELIEDFPNQKITLLNYHTDLYAHITQDENA